MSEIKLVDCATWEIDGYSPHDIETKEKIMHATSVKLGNSKVLKLNAINTFIRLFSLPLTRVCVTNIGTQIWPSSKMIL